MYTNRSVILLKMLSCFISSVFYFSVFKGKSATIRQAEFTAPKDISGGGSDSHSKK